MYTHKTRVLPKPCMLSTKLYSPTLLGFAHYTYAWFMVIYVTDGMFCKNGTISVPNSVLRYVVDKVRLFVPI